MKVSRADRVVGEVRVPGDKSISHRAAMLSAIADGATRITNYATSVDCANTLECFRRLGVTIEKSGTDVTIHGVGKRGLIEPTTELDCSNSGTTMRLISGILAGQSFRSTLTGDASLCSRPMKRIIEPLTQMGAEIESSDGHAPLIIRGDDLRAIRYEPPVASAQIKSCVLLAGLFAEGRTTVVEKTPTRDHTERMLRHFGVTVNNLLNDGHSEISVDGGAVLKARHIDVPGDISSAAFLLVAAACLPDSNLKLLNMGVNPTRSAILDVLHGFGIGVRIENLRESSGEPVADIAVSGTRSEPANVDNSLRGKIIANLIDEIPILAVLGTQLKNGLEVRDAGELRVKESDRIAAVAENLRRMNAEIEEYPDGFRVGRSKLKGAKIDSFGDHRIAMAFGIAGLFADGETAIVGADCVDVSFPDFFDLLSHVAGQNK